MKYLIGFALAFPVMAAAQTPRPISLDEAVKLAQRNSQATVVARNSVEQNQVAVRTAWGRFLPDLSLSGQGSKSGGKTLLQGELRPYSGDWNFQRGLSTSLTLFDAGQRMHQLSNARANVASAEANEQQANYAVALQVSSQYYGVLAARESRGAAQAQLQQAQEQMKVANAKLAAGATTKSDSLRSIISVGQAQLALLTAENDLQVANVTLTRLVGTQFVVTAAETDSLRAEALDVDSAALVAQLETTPPVVAARAAVNASRSAVKAARTPYFPTLSLNGGMNQSNTSPTFDFGGGQFGSSNSISLRVSYTLFDRFAREQTIANSRIAEDNAVAALRETRLQAQQSLITYIGSLRLATENIKIQQASVDAAQEDVRVQQQRYALGATTLLDLLTSQSSLNSARNQLIRARRDARIARANIEALIGQPLR